MITISQVGNNQYFGTWLVRVNQIASIIGSNTVTADATSNGSLTTGNSFVNGSFGTVNLAVANGLSGGSIATPGNLVITTNTTFASGLSNLISISSNATNSSINISVKSLIVNTLSTSIGNSTVNATLNSTSYSGSANNALFIGGLPAANVVSNAQLTSNLANYANTIQLAANLANYQTLLGLSANVASLTSNNATNFGGHAVAYFANVTNPGFTTSISVGANVNVNTSTMSIGNSTVNTTINSIFLQTGLINANNVNVAANVTILGSLNVSGNVTSTGTSIANGSQIPVTDNTFSIGNTTNRWLGYFNTISVGNSTANVTINTTSFSGTANNALNLGGVAAASYQLNSTLAANVATMTANNATNFGGLTAASYANTSAPVFSLTIGVGANVNVNTSVISVGNTTVNSTINSTAFSGAANNASFIGGLPAANVVSNAQLTSNLANYQTITGLSANVAGLTVNNATNLGGHAAAFYANTTSFTGQFDGTNLNASGWANIVGQANIGAGVVSTGIDNGGFGGQYRLVDGTYGVILRNDGTTFYLMQTANANTTGTWNTFRPFSWSLTTGVVSIDGTGANTTFGGNILTPGNLLIGNSTINTTINSTSFTGTANNASFIGGLPAANVVSNAQLAANIQFFVNTSQLTANLGNYQTTAGLAANVVTLAANNTSYLGGQLASFYANTTSYPGAFNGTTINASGNAFVNSYLQSISILTTNVIANATITNSNLGTVMLVGNTADIYILVPNTMPSNAKLLVTRVGTGNVFFTNAAGVVLGSRTGNFNIISQYGSISLFTVNSSLAIIDGNI